MVWMVSVYGDDDDNNINIYIFIGKFISLIAHYNNEKNKGKHSLI